MDLEEIPSDDTSSETSSSVAATRSVRIKIQQRRNLLSRLQSCHIDFGTSSLRQLEAKLGLVERQYNALDALQTQLEELDETQLDDNHRLTFEESYVEAKAAILDRMAALQAMETTQHFSSTHISHERSQASRINLPKIQLTIFSGEQREWLDFFNVFLTLVHNNKDLSDVEKFQYLRSCLTDKASRLIQSLEVTKANYKVALDLIIARFNNSRLIFQAHMQQICEIQPLSSSNVPSLRNFIDTVRVNLRAMQSLATTQQIGDAILLYLVSSKLDSSTRARWEEEVASKWNTTSSSAPLQMPTWADLATFLECRCQTFNVLEINQSSNQHRSVTHKNSPKTSHRKNQLAFVAAAATTKCIFCGASPYHTPFDCQQFTSMDTYERYLRVKRLNLCLNCLGKNHTSNTCSSRRRCQHCHVSHHTLLHRTYGTAELPNTNNNDNAQASADDRQTTLQAVGCSENVILATARVRLCNSSGSSFIARILLDSGSQLNFVTEHLAQHLRLPRTKRSIEVTGIGATTTKTHHMCVVNMKSLHTEYSSNFEAVIIPSITSQQPSSHINMQSWELPRNVKLADESFQEPGGIDCLIGAGLFFDLLLVGQIKHPNNSPILQKTKLGWIVSGTAKSPPQCESSSSLNHTFSSSLSSSSSPVYKSFVATTDQPPLDHLLEKFWALEGYDDSSKKLSAEERACEEFFESTYTRCPISKKFIVRLPFKDDPQTLGRSYDTAYKRLVSLEYKFSKNPSLFKSYSEFMEEYSKMQHMSTVESSENGRYFIPHHSVVKADSSTTKLRVVFDASCHTSNGKSLNDILRVGPTLQSDIFTSLVRFRSHKYVLMADIAKMYRQVLVDKADAPWQCILWRESPLAPVQAYQLQTVTYGTSSAPYLATKCLMQLAKDEAKKFPIGSAVTLKDFYVDNLMTGAATIDEVIEIKNQVTALLHSGGFPLRKFAANENLIIDDVPDEDREEIVKLDNAEYVKTLGLKWSPSQDVFIFSYNTPSALKKTTKRAILSQIASFFDPLGLLNPLIVSCKILMQQLWALKLNWDESVPQDVYTQWCTFQHQLRLIDNIQIPRYVPLNSSTEIHAFSDASTKAYGACVYIVTRTAEGATSSLVCAKSRVAPKKEISLPRLELCATMLLAELLQTIISILPVKVENVHCWSDSTIALCWIRGEPSRWTVFVANRVSKIQQLTSQYSWHHVPTLLNPADLVSRGATVADLSGNALWFQGPPFLKSSVESWPTSAFDTPAEVPEQRKQRTVLLIEQQSDIFAENKYINNYNKLLRIFTYVRWFISKTRVSSITAAEITDTLHMICRRIQQAYFADEYFRLQNNELVKRTSKLSSLAPFMHDGVIRVGGRIQNSSLSFDAKHPIVLPRSHPFIHTLIAYHHRKHLHAGAQTLQNILRDKFWIIGARTTIRQVIHSCIMCYRLRPIVEQQIMGALPASRITASHPFETTGVDFCGPLLITQQIRGRAPIKVYISVFICFTTKAVHFELVPDLSSAAFIAALKRFVARRGKCRVIVSDNATNFVGANRELRELLLSFTTQEHIEAVETYCTNEGIEWRFIPPRSPHFGGLWESAVKLAKHHLRRAIATSILSHDELHTIVCQAEAVVNSRPLTPLSSDPNDLRSLTPAHFLVGRILTTIAEPTPSSSTLSALKRYQIVQHIQQQFWQRWQHDYLKELQKRTKWNASSPNLMINDLVLLKDDITPPLKWPMGRIVNVVPGDDGKVRVAIVKTADGVYKRAIARLCKLPIENQAAADC